MAGAVKLWSGFMTARGWDTHRHLAEDLAEARWLLDVARGMGTSHVAVITELAGTTPEVLDVLVGEISARGMTPVLWTSKGFALPWFHATGETFVRELARRYPGALFDIAREADFLWQIHDRPEEEVVGYLWRLKLALLEEGIAPENIMAGGHTLAGAISLDRVGPGWVTVTGYTWVDEAFRRDPARWLELLADVVKEQLLELRRRTDLSHRIAVAEIGWPSSHGSGRQAEVYRETLRGIAASGVVDGVGFWQLPDFVHCGDRVGNSAAVGRCDAGAVSFGLLGSDGLPKPAFVELWTAWL